MLYGGAAWLMLVTSISQGQAQLPQTTGVYQPMHQNMPPGMAGYWAGALGKATPNYFQPIRVELPSNGSVTVYRGPGREPQPLSAPALIGVGVGYIYRLRIANMPEFPGVELFPSVEILDQLHPPAGKAADFPVPVQILQDEIESVLSGRMVTKVIYLEQPNLAQLREQSNTIPVLTLSANRNLIAEADRIGRPMLILRIGGRLPDARQPDPAFFGLGAPIRILSQETANSIGTLRNTNAISLPMLNQQPTALESDVLRRLQVSPSSRTQKIGASSEYLDALYMTLRSTNTPSFPMLNHQPAARLQEIDHGSRKSIGSSIQSRNDFVIDQSRNVE